MAFNFFSALPSRSLFLSIPDASVSPSPSSACLSTPSRSLVGVATEHRGGSPSCANLIPDNKARRRGRTGGGPRHRSFLIMSRRHRWKVVNVSSRRSSGKERDGAGIIRAAACTAAAESRKIKTRRGPGKCHRERFRRKDLGHKYVTRTFAAALFPQKSFEERPLNSTIMIMIGCRSCRSPAARAHIGIIARIRFEVFTAASPPSPRPRAARTLLSISISEVYNSP